MHSHKHVHHNNAHGQEKDNHSSSVVTTVITDDAHLYDDVHVDNRSSTRSVGVGQGVSNMELLPPTPHAVGHRLPRCLRYHLMHERCIHAAIRGDGDTGRGIRLG